MTQPDLPDWLTKVALTADTVIDTPTLGNAVQSAVYDVSTFQSVLITSPAPSPVGLFLTVQWYDQAGNAIDSEYVSSPVGVASATPQLNLPVRYPKLSIMQVSGAPQSITFTVYGTIRNIRSLHARVQPDAKQYTDGGTAKVVNVAQSLGTTPPGGQYWLHFQSTGATVGGVLLLATQALVLATNLIYLTDTALAHNIGGNLNWMGQVILPRSPCTLFFLPTAAGTNTITASFISLEQW